MVLLRGWRGDFVLHRASLCVCPCCSFPHLPSLPWRSSGLAGSRGPVCLSAVSVLRSTLKPAPLEAWRPSPHPRFHSSNVGASGALPGPCQAPSLTTPEGMARSSILSVPSAQQGGALGGGGGRWVRQRAPSQAAPRHWVSFSLAFSSGAPASSPQESGLLETNCQISLEIKKHGSVLPSYGLR